MTSQEFVKEKYPNAFVEHYKTNNPFDKKGYWICWDKRRGMHLSETHKSESNAWLEAKKYIKSRDGLN